MWPCDSNRITKGAHSHQNDYIGNSFHNRVRSPQGGPNATTHIKSSFNIHKRKLQRQSTITSFLKSSNVNGISGKNGHEFRNASSSTSQTEFNTHENVKCESQVISSSSLSAYYNNMRCNTNERNICMKIELSVYKILCLTETWLSNEHSSSVYFPSSFTVYRSDRTINSARRSGGMAVLVHRSIKSKLVQLIVAADPDCEFLLVEIIVKPTPLIFYVCYMSTFDYQTAVKHYERIKIAMETYINHRIIVLGDFNLHDIAWSADVNYNNAYLPHSITNTATNQRRSQYNEAALDFLHQIMEIPLFQMSNFQNVAANVLDLMFVNKPADFAISKDQFTIVE